MFVIEVLIAFICLVSIGAITAAVCYTIDKKRDKKEPKYPITLNDVIEHTEDIKIKEQYLNDNFKLKKTEKQDCKEYCEFLDMIENSNTETNNNEMTM